MAVLQGHKLDFDICKHIKIKFAGSSADGAMKYPEWINLWDTNLPRMKKLDFSDLEIFYELRKVLKDSALKLISGITQPNNHSYKEAMKMLQKRYGRKDTLITETIDSLLTLPKYEDNLEGVREGSNDIRKLVNNLDDLGLSAEQQKFCYLYGIIHTKIPKGVIEKFQDKKLKNRDTDHPIGSKICLADFWATWDLSLIHI